MGILGGLSLVSCPEPQTGFVRSQFPDETLRSGELLNMIVAVIDSFQVRGNSSPFPHSRPLSPFPGGLTPKRADRAQFRGFHELQFPNPGRTQPQNLRGSPALSEG